jgi:hypothetical protein
MRLPAQRKLDHQAAYPSQAEGGFAGDLHSSVHKALVAWEKKRNPGEPFRYGKSGSSQFKKEKTTASREEISWNKAPEVKKESKKRAVLTAEQYAAKLEYNRERRAKLNAEKREELLAIRRAVYLAKRGGTLQKRSRMSPEQRKASVKAAKQRYLERQKAGLVAKTVRKPSKLSPERLAKKAEAQRKYAQSTKK